MKVIDWILERKSEELFAWSMEELIKLIKNSPDVYAIIATDSSNLLNWHRGLPNWHIGHREAADRILRYIIELGLIKERLIMNSVNIEGIFKEEAEFVFE